MRNLSRDDILRMTEQTETTDQLFDALVSNRKPQTGVSVLPSQTGALDAFRAAAAIFYLAGTAYENSKKLVAEMSLQETFSEQRFAAYEALEAARAGALEVGISPAQLATADEEAFRAVKVKKGVS